MGSNSVQTRKPTYGSDAGSEIALCLKELSEDQLGKCDHAIKVPGALYEVGVVRKGKSYILLYDEWVKGGLRNKLGENAGLLKQAYTIETLRKEARRKNYRFHESKMKQGIRVTLTL